MNAIRQYIHVVVFVSHYFANMKFDYNFELGSLGSK